jgi:hypothetical protein
LLRCREAAGEKFYKNYELDKLLVSFKESARMAFYSKAGSSLNHQPLRRSLDLKLAWMNVQETKS